ncbi:MAG: WD40 repeat domain-containing protein [Fimbriiglobus sp.]
MLTIPTDLKEIRRITLSPSGRFAVVEDLKQLRIWDFHEQKIILGRKTLDVSRPFFLNDDELLYANGCAQVPGDAYLYPQYHICSLQKDHSKELLVCQPFGVDPNTDQILGFRYGVGVVAFDPHGRDAFETHSLPGRTITFFEDGFYLEKSNSILIVSIDNNDIYFFDTHVWRRSTEIQSSLCRYKILSHLNISPGGERFVATNNTKILIWETAKLADPPRVFQNTTRKNFTDIAFDPSGRYLLSASNDAAIKLWDVESGEILRDYDFGQGRMRSIAVAPDGLTALAGTDKGALLQFDLDL